MTKTSTAANEAAQAKKSAPVAPVTTLPETGQDRHLQIAEQPGKTRERLLTDVVAQGLAVNASTAMRFVKPEYGDLSLTDMVASIRESGDAINRDDMAAAERLLYSQTIALNAIFGELARVSKANMFTNLDAMDRYMRLALKAQSQSRMTVETLTAMKNPPVMFARQANINNGGQFQLNQGETQQDRLVQPVRPVRARARKSGKSPIKQPEQQHGKWMDPRATSAASGADPHVEALGALNGTKKRRG